MPSPIFKKSVARKLADIASFIRSRDEDFFFYLKKSLDTEIWSFLERIFNAGSVYLFSGIIRDYFLRKEGIRDIDIFIEGDPDIEIWLKGYSYSKNNLNGYKVRISDISIDIWHLKHTWALENDQTTLEFDLAKYVPYTAFFNFSSIIYSFHERKFFFTSHFLRFLRDKKIDFVYQANPNYALCIVNTFYYNEKFSLKISSRLKNHILKLYPQYIHQFESVQWKHFGKLIFTEKELLEKIKRE